MLQLRRDDTCSTCGRLISAGTKAYWLKPERLVVCTACAEADVPPVSAPGSSARREYERRRQNREARERERGRLRGWAAQRSSGPQHERAWARGAAGEQENARRFERLLDGKPVVVLHDRHLPGQRSNLDHIAIGPGGITVVDSKKLAGKVKIDWRGGLFSERRFDLYVNGRKRTNLIEGVERQVERVRSVLTQESLSDVPVRGALCMADPAGLPLLKRLKIRDIAIDGPRPITKLMAREGKLDDEAVMRVAAILDHRFPPA